MDTKVLFAVILVCITVCILVVPVFAGDELDQSLAASLSVSVAQDPVALPGPDNIASPTEAPTPDPTPVPTMSEVTAIPTTAEVTTVPTTTEITVAPTETQAGASGDTNITGASGGSGGDTSVQGNTTVDLPGSNASVTTPVPSPDTNSTSLQDSTNYTWSDPPLNTSGSNPYYTGTGWIVNESGHDWVMDLNISHNTDVSGVHFDGVNTFSNFGTGSNSFAILINVSNVIFDGMGAILDGGGNTAYGIIVNQQNAGDNPTSSLGPLSGISITNITLTGFTQAGIFFNNVIGSQSEVSSNITSVHADSNRNAGIVLTDSEDVELRDNTANNNGNSSQPGSDGYGIVLENSSRNTLYNNTAQGNCGGGGLNQNTNGSSGYGIYLRDSDYNNLTRNNASSNYGSNSGEYYEGNAGNGYGIYLDGSVHNNLTGNTANGNHGGYAPAGYIDQVVSIHSASGEHSSSMIFDNKINGGDGYGIYLNRSGSNLLSGNNASGNYGGDSDTDVSTSYLLRLSGSAVFSGDLLANNSFNGGNGYGIVLAGSDENNLTGNTARDNYGGLNGIFDLEYFSFRAIDGGSSSFNFTLENVASGGNGYGICLDNSSGSSLSDNHVAGNHGSPEDGTGVNYTIEILTGNGGVYDGSLIFHHLNAGNAGYGIYLNASPGTTLEGNEASGNRGGLAGGTMGIAEINITTMNGGISIGDPETPFVNTGGYGYGIYVLGSGNTTMRNNRMDENDGNFALYGSGDFHFANDIDTTNLVDGRKVLYLRDAHGLVVGPSSDAGTVYVINGSGVTLRDLVLLDNGPGVLLWNTTDSTLRNITAANNDYGIVLGRSSGNHVEDSNASVNRQHGIVLAGSSGNTLGNNTASGNTYAGIVLYASDGNTVVNNTASGNGFAGFEFRRADDNTVQDNHATGNYGTWNGYGYGFYLAGSDNNSFPGNYATGNHGGNGTHNVSQYSQAVTTGNVTTSASIARGVTGTGSP